MSNFSDIPILWIKQVTYQWDDDNVCFVLNQQATMSFIFVIESYLFEWKQLCGGFFLFVYICIAIADPIFKMGMSWDPILWFTPNTFLHLSQARIWISINLYCRPFCFQWFEMRGSYLFCWYWWNFLPSLIFASINTNFIVWFV